jgi:hypothetical protein
MNWLKRKIKENRQISQKFSSNFCCAVRMKMWHFFKSLWQQMKCGCTIMNLKPCVNLWSNPSSKIHLCKEQQNTGFGGETYGNSFLGCRWCYPHGFLWNWDNDRSRVILRNIQTFETTIDKDLKEQGECFAAK